MVGNIFHAMDKTNVPVKHEARKAFFMALHNAYLLWNKNKIEELEGNMTVAGMAEDKIKQERHHLPALYHRCVDWCVLHLKESCIRVQAVYAAMGYLIDSITGKLFFNMATWKRTDSVLSEILLGLYSDVQHNLLERKWNRNDKHIQ